MKPLVIQSLSINNPSLHLQVSYFFVLFLISRSKVSFNPNDSSEILITGNEIFQQYRLNNKKFYPNIQRCESMNIISHCWFNENEILLAIQGGFIYTITKHGNILQRYNINDDILCLIRYSRGVFVSTK